MRFGGRSLSAAAGVDSFALMAVEFLTDEQAASYGKFNEEPTRPELDRFFPWSTRTAR